MKKLTKIKLVNWHIFPNETIDIKDNVLLTGENGSGKSTLLDAIQFLLIGGRRESRFNTAASADSKRTLDGYVRGKISADDKEYLRTGDVCTHIALEFEDSKNNQTTVVGVLLELPKHGSLKERLYIIPNFKIVEPMFLDGKLPRDFRSMKAFFKSIDIPFEPFDTTKKYREALSSYLGIDANKYAKLLPRALGFKARDIQPFIFEFLLDEDPVDISALKNSVNELKKVEQIIKNDKAKLVQLEKISTLASAIEDNDSQLSINELLTKMVEIEQSQTFLTKAQDQIDKLDAILEKGRTETENLNEQINKIGDDIAQIQLSISSSDAGARLKKYNDDLEAKEQQYSNAKQFCDDLRSTLNEEVKILTTLQEKRPSVNITNFLKYYQTSGNNLDVFQLTEVIEKLSGENQALRPHLEVEQTKIKETRTILTNELAAVDQQLRSLKRNQRFYPQHVEKLISIISDQLSSMYEKDISVRPLCEMLEVNDEKWRNALEGYLGGQKYDLIVEPMYFQDAINIYEREQKSQNIYGVGIVNTAKISTFKTHRENSLASKLTAGNDFAQYYINMLIGEVICVDNVNELKNFSRSVSASCMTYSNFTARAMNPRGYEIPVIGLKSNQLQVAKYEEEYAQIADKLANLTTQFNKNEAILRQLSLSKLPTILLQGNLRYFALIKTVRAEIIDLEESIESFDKSNALKTLESDLQKLNQRRAQLRDQHQAVSTKMGDARALKSAIIERRTQADDAVTRLMAEQKELSDKTPVILNKSFVQLTALKKRFEGNLERILVELINSSQKLKSESQRVVYEVQSHMRVYNITFNFGAAADISELAHYESEASRLRDVDIIKHENQATNLRHAAEVSFKEEFVNKLRESIEEAQRQLIELNKTLKGVHFGVDSYQLITKPAEDPIFNMYYKMLTSVDTLGTDELFVDSLSKRNESILAELFGRISSINEDDEKLAMQLLDYRNYMSYDIEITNKEGRKFSFTKAQHEKSGGETQSPIYIVMAASFQQLLTKNKKHSTGCIVLFDEAFSKMDDSKVDAIMRFYSELEIQVIISVPPTKAQEIASFVDTYVALVKSKDIARVQNVRIDRMEKN